MAETPKPSGAWTTFAGVVMLAFGVGVILLALRDRPLPRERLSVAEHVGPMDIDMPLVSTGIGRSRGSYRTQRIPLVAAGRMLQTYSPARELWVDDTGTIRYGQKVSFLVDPETGLIYEATTPDKTLLSYEDTAEALSASVRYRILMGLGLVALAAYHLGPIVRRRWQAHRDTTGADTA